METGFCHIWFSVATGGPRMDPSQILRRLLYTNPFSWKSFKSCNFKSDFSPPNSVKIHLIPVRFCVANFLLTGKIVWFFYMIGKLHLYSQNTTPLQKNPHIHTLHTPALTNTTFVNNLQVISNISIKFLMCNNLTTASGILIKL